MNINNSYYSNSHYYKHYSQETFALKLKRDILKVKVIIFLNFLGKMMINLIVKQKARCLMDLLLFL